MRIGKGLCRGYRGWVVGGASPSPLRGASKNNVYAIEMAHSGSFLC